MTLEEVSRRTHVKALRQIPDSPLTGGEVKAWRGDVGEVCDVDFANGIAFVDFGGGAIACTADELQPAMRSASSPSSDLTKEDR